MSNSTGKPTSEDVSLQRLCKAVEHRDPAVRSPALRDLGTKGEQARVAVPALVRLLVDLDPNTRHLASETLRKIDPDWADSAGPAVPTLIKALDSQFQVVAHEAAKTLSLLGSPAVPDLRRILREGEPTAKVVACRVLGNIGPAAKDAATDLCLALDKPQWIVCQAAAQALGKIGIGTPETIQGLIRLLGSHPHEEVKQAAAESIGKLRSAESRVMMGLLEAAADPSQSVRKVALAALQRCNGPDVVSGLVTGLQSPTAVCRVTAAFLLGLIGNAAASAVADLRRALGDEAPSVRLAVAKTLEKLDPQAPIVPSAADSLVEMLKTEAMGTFNRRISSEPAGFGFAHLTLQETDIRWALAKVQDQLGPVEASCTPEFLLALNSPEPLVAPLAAAWIEGRSRRA